MALLPPNTRTRKMNATTYTIAMNGNGQFFAIARHYDNSVGEHGPFATGEAAAAEIARLEQFDRDADDAQDDYNDSRD